MDREKLEKEADRWTHFYNTEMKTESVPYDERFKKGFIKGADWLMQQPLSERLTDEEKEKIRDIIKYPQRYTVPIDGTLFPQVIVIQKVLTNILGADLFKEK